MIGNTKKIIHFNARTLKTLTRFHIVRFSDAPIILYIKSNKVNEYAQPTFMA